MASGDDNNVGWLYSKDQPDGEPPRRRARKSFAISETDLPPDAAQHPKRLSFSEQDGPPPARSGETRVHQAVTEPPPPTQRPKPAPRPVDQPGQPRQGKRPKRRRRGRTVVITAAVVIVAILAYLIGVPMLAWNNTSRIQAMPTGQRPPEQPGTVSLLVGSDGREKLTAEERRRLGTGTTSGQRTDTMMLLVRPTTGQPALISLPRDSYVPIPGHGKNKLNAAYAFGGAPLLVHAVEQNTGVRIDNYMEIGFGGFANIIDALGGIEMCLKKPIKDRDSHLNLPAGCQNLDGKNALGYVRMRKADLTGDIGRMKRQREMVSAVAKKAASPLNIILPNRYWALSNAGASAVTVDEDTGILDAFSMARALMGMGGNGSLTLSVPISDADATTSAGSSMIWDKKRAQEMFGQVARGDTTGLEKFAKS